MTLAVRGGSDSTSPASPVGSDAGERHVIGSIRGLGDVAFRVSAFPPPPGVEQLPDTMVVGVRRRKLSRVVCRERPTVCLMVGRLRL